MTVLLVGVCNRVVDVAVGLDVPFDRMGADALAGVAVGPIDDAAPASICAQPEHAVVQLG